MINFCSFPTKNNKSKNSGGISMGTLAFDKKYIYNKLLKKKKKKDCRDAVSDGTNRSIN